MWKGELPAAGAAVLVPKVIDSITIEASRNLPIEGIALASANFLGVGNPENPRNYATGVELYDPRNGRFLFEMRGLMSGEIEISEHEKQDHLFTRVAWDADIDMLMAAETAVVQRWFERKTIQDVMNLVAHKKPGLSVLELNMNPDDGSSLWVQEIEAVNQIRAACSQYHFAVRNLKILINAQEQLASHQLDPQFHLLDVSKPTAVISGTVFDLVIVKSRLESGVDESVIIQSLAASVRKGGFIVASGVEEAALNCLSRTTALEKNVCICHVEESKADNDRTRTTVSHVSFLDLATQQSSNMAEMLDALAAKQWALQSYSDPLKEIKIVVVLDELFASIIDRLDEQQWAVLKHLIQQRCYLWVTTGAHLSVTDPTKATIAGLLRTIRAEEQLRLTTLDVERPTGDTTAAAISACLERLCGPESDSGNPTDSEFVERGGVVHVSRLLPDTNLTALQSDELSARTTEIAELHASKALIQLRSERLGNLDALHFGEVAPEMVPLPDGLLEVEIYAAGLNYKDVVVTMGIVPGDETALGHEAAGIVSSITPGVSGFAIGERVVVFGKGCFANRVQTTPSRVHRIPDDMSFDEAATLTVVYMTSIYSLFDLGNLSTSKRLLVHSAAGGVGIAAVQLAQYVGAEVFATVSTPEKRQFLKSTFGLSGDHIFNSRNVDFAG